MISRPASASSGSAACSDPWVTGGTVASGSAVERRQRAGRNDDQPRVHRSDERDEKADAHADRAAQVERDRPHHRLAHADKHEREHDEAVHHDQPHRRLPRAGLSRDLKRDNGVQPHAGRERDGKVRAEAHEQRADCRGGRRCRGGRLERDSRRCEDRRIGEQDVRHRQERGDAAADFARHRRATFLKIEMHAGKRPEVYPNGPATSNDAMSGCSTLSALGFDSSATVLTALTTTTTAATFATSIIVGVVFVVTVAIVPGTRQAALRCRQRTRCEAQFF